jgi:hypothetical protein
MVQFFVLVPSNTTESPATGAVSELQLPAVLQLLPLPPPS